MVNVGDTVYLIYVGLVTVQSVDKDGSITFYLYDDTKLHTVGTSHYREMERMEHVRHPTKNVDYTTEVIRCQENGNSTISNTQQSQY